ncbi:nucleoside-specific channel-forming protein Tsx [Paraburkholderia xenovorans]
MDPRRRPWRTAPETGSQRRTRRARVLAISAAALALSAAQQARADTLAEIGGTPPELNTPVLSNTAAGQSQYLSDWLHQSLGVIGSKDIRFGPYRTNDVYLEYEYFGRKGPFDLYGYVDVPRAFGVGNGYDTGITNKGSPLFTEQEPRVSIDDLLGKHLGFGPFKEWYAAFDWIYDQGHNVSGRQNTLYMGLGTDIATPLPVYLSANLYVRRQWENYGAANANSWDGYRAQMKMVYPIGTLKGGNLTFVSFFNYDFGSRLAEETGGNTRSDTAFVSTNVLIYEFKHWRFWTAARYFHNGGQWNGSTLNFGSGPFQNRSTGWGYYASVGYRF